MPTYSRRQIVVEDEVGVYHCVARCVRPAFLCGVDSYTGRLDSVGLPPRGSESECAGRLLRPTSLWEFVGVWIPLRLSSPQTLALPTRDKTCERLSDRYDVEEDPDRGE
jgi:hypothetical protein